MTKPRPTRWPGPIGPLTDESPVDCMRPPPADGRRLAPTSVVGRRCAGLPQGVAAVAFCRDPDAQAAPLEPMRGTTAGSGRVGRPHGPKPHDGTSRRGGSTRCGSPPPRAILHGNATQLRGSSFPPRSSTLRRCDLRQAAANYTILVSDVTIVPLPSFWLAVPSSTFVRPAAWRQQTRPVGSQW